MDHLSADDVTGAVRVSTRLRELGLEGVVPVWHDGDVSWRAMRGQLGCGGSTRARCRLHASFSSVSSLS
jgi:hypothetical protein